GPGARPGAAESPLWVNLRRTQREHMSSSSLADNRHQRVECRRGAGYPANGSTNACHSSAPGPQGGTMITRFMTVYPGHIDMPDLGQDATPANERNYSNEQLVSVFDKLEAIAKQMDRFGWDTLWLAEHHFQREGYEVLPNLLILAVHLAHVTKRL